MILLLLILSVMGMVFFFVRWLQLRSGYHGMSDVERRYVEVSAIAAERSAEDTSLATRRRKLLVRWGLPNTSLPLFAMGGFGYLTVASVLRAVGLSPLLAVALAVPAAVLIFAMGLRISNRRRTDRFATQMVSLLDMLVAQLQGGLGVDRALTAALPNLQDPIRGEIAAALQAAASGGSLIDSLKDTKERYPSRAIDLFVAALEINSKDGHSIAPSLDQASSMLKQAFTLQSEGRAELGSAKWEFYGVLAVVVGLSVQMIFSSEDAAATWANPLGIIVLILAASNTGFGVWRFTRIIDRLKKETE